MSLGDLKYIPGIVFAVGVLVGVFGLITLGAIALVVTEPQVEVLGLVVLAGISAFESAKARATRDRRR